MKTKILINHSKIWVWFLLTFALLASCLLLAKTSLAAEYQVTGRVVLPNGNPCTDTTQVQGCVWPDFPCQTGGCGGCSNISSDGTFAVNLTQTGQFRVRAETGQNYTYTPSVTKIINLNGATNVGDLVLTTPNLQGTVVASDGTTPVEDAGVDVFSRNSNINYNTRTNASGQFRFGGVAVGEYNLSINPPQESSDTRTEMTITITDAGTLKDLGTIVLDAPNIIGRVVHPDGTPLIWQDTGQPSDIREEAYANLYNQDHSVQKNANTDHQGYFRVGTVPSGQYTLEVRAGWNMTYTNAVPQTITVVSGTLLNVGDIPLTTAQVTGYVYEADGTTPVNNANVQIYLPESQFNQNTSTNDQGYYQLGGITAGTYRMRVNAPWNRTDLISPDEIEVTIPATGTISRNFNFVTATKTLSGTVTKDNGEAVTLARVEANKQSTGSHAEARTNTNGSYTLMLTGGLWEIRVNPDSQPGSTPDWVFSGQSIMVEFANDTTTETQTLNLTVQRATATVRGRVILANGTPLTAGNVDIHNQEGQGNSTPINPDGTFSIRVPAGSYYLSIHHPDNRYSFPNREITVGEDQTLDLGDLTVTEKTAHIQGLATKKDGTPLANIRINAWKQMEQSGWSNITTGTDGTFDLLVDVGRWGIGLDQGQNTTYVYDGPPVDVDITSETQTVTGITLALTYADVVVSGSVVDDNGQTVRNFCAYAYARPIAVSSFGDRGPEYGGPVNCQNGAFSFRIPSSVASSYYLGVHTPPNSDYSAAAEQNIAVFADTPVTANIIVLRNDASISGRILDQDDTPLTSCDFRGRVDVGTEQDWRGTDIRPDCTYSLSLLGGREYNLNYWIPDGQGFMSGHHQPEQFTIAANQQLTKDIRVIRADARITGQVLAPNGSPLTSGWVDVGNWPEITHGPEGPTEEDTSRELHAGGQIQPDGTFTIDVLTNHLYMIHVGVPPETNYLSPQEVEVDFTDGSTLKQVTLQVRAALGQMTGQVNIGGIPVNMGFVHCWSEEGGGTGGQVEYGGTYRLNYAAGVWHCGADSFNGTTFYRSQDLEITITDQTSLTQNFTLQQSNFQVPPPVTITFDAGNPQVITLENGTTVNIPAGALGESGTNVSVTASPTVDMIHTQLDRPFGVGYSLVAQDSDNNQITTFNSNVTITFYYTDEQLAELGLDEDTLVSKYYDENTNTWMNPSGMIQDKERNMISISTNHFTKFAIVSTGGAGSIISDEVVKNKRVLLATPDANGGPQVVVLRNNGEQRLSFMAYDSTFRGTYNTAMGDINGDGNQEIIVAPGPGFGPQVKVFDQQGHLRYQFMAYDSSFRGGVSIAAGDVDNDGIDEIITLPLSNGGSNTRIFGLRHGQFQATTVNFFVFPQTLRGGFDLTMPDLEGDGLHEIVVAPLSGGSSHVQVFGYRASERRFRAVILGLKVYPEAYHGGIVLDKGDVDADGDDEVFTGAYQNGGPHVVTLYRNRQGRLTKLTNGFMAFDPAYRGGISLAGTDVNNDGKADIAVSVRAGQQPVVKLFKYDGSEVYAQWYAYPQTFMGGVNLSSGQFATVD